MASCVVEHHAHKVGLGETGYTAPTRNGRPQGGGNVLKGGGPSNTTVWFGNVGPFGGNVEEGRRVTRRVPQTDHGEVTVVDRIRHVGDDRGGSIAGSGENTVGDDLYIGIRKATVAQWVTLQPILEVCAGEKGCEGGGLSREAWWLQEATEKQLQATLERISWEEKKRRRLRERYLQ